MFVNAAASGGQPDEKALRPAGWTGMVDIIICLCDVMTGSAIVDICDGDDNEMDRGGVAFGGIGASDL